VYLFQTWQDQQGDKCFTVATFKFILEAAALLGLSPEALKSRLLTRTVKVPHARINSTKMRYERAQV